MTYMDEFLVSLREKFGITDSEALDFIRAEVLQSYKNGIARGRKQPDGRCSSRKADSAKR